VHQPTLVYLHGLASSMMATKAEWLRQFAIDKQMGFLRFDYRGHGRSPGVFDELGVDDWYEDVLVLLEHYALENVVLLGSSLGGWIMLRVANILPVAPLGLIGVVPAVNCVDHRLWEKMVQQQTLLGGVVCELAQPLTAHQVARSQASCLNLTGTVHYSMPVRLLFGSQDVVVPWTLGLYLHNCATWHDCSVQVIGSADHRFQSSLALHAIETALYSLLRYPVIL